LKQIDVLEHTKPVETEDSLVSETVDADQVAEIIARWTGIPLSKLNQSEVGLI